MADFKRWSGFPSFYTTVTFDLLWGKHVRRRRINKNVANCSKIQSGYPPTVHSLQPFINPVTWIFKSLLRNSFKVSWSSVFRTAIIKSPDSQLSSSSCQTGCLLSSSCHNAVTIPPQSLHQAVISKSNINIPSPNQKRRHGSFSNWAICRNSPQGPLPPPRCPTMASSQVFLPPRSSGHQGKVT